MRSVILRPQIQASRPARLLHLLTILALALTVTVSAAPAQAATITVDGTTCTLVDAITAANTDTATGGCAAGTPGADTITLLDDVTLTTVNTTGGYANAHNIGLPIITSVITIEGAGYTIARDLGAPRFRIFQIESTGDLTLNDLTLTGGDTNINPGDFSGALSVNNGSATLNNSTVSGNGFNLKTAIFNHDGSLTLNNSTVSNNGSGSGGGIAIQTIGELGTATTMLNNSTVSGNSGMGASATSFINFDTFDGGTANLIVTNSTISNNEIAGLLADRPDGVGTANITLVRSVVSGNIQQEILTVGGTVTSNNYNVVGYDGSARSSGFTPSSNDIVPAGPLSSILDTTLQNNGGDTETHALVTGSPAIDAAPGGPATDQRGISRPQGTDFDIGAFELEATSNETGCDALNAVVPDPQTDPSFYSFTVSGLDFFPGDTIHVDLTITRSNDVPFAEVAVLDSNGAPLASDGQFNLSGQLTVAVDYVVVAGDDADGVKVSASGSPITSFTVDAVNISCTPAQQENQPPVANAGPDQSVFRNDTVTVSGMWADPDEAADNPYTWEWDLDGDGIADDSGSANYGDTIDRTTSFAVDGVATLTFTVTDSVGATSSDTLDITVVNRAPTADDQSVTTDEDTALPITLTADDADGDTLTYTVIDLPTNGTLSGTAPNLTYTPDANFNGSDGFTFQANDGLADSNIATVDITVDAVNDPVVAGDDSAITDEDTAVTIDVQDNDSAGPANEDQTLTTTAVTNPANGTAVINGDGTVTYTPDLDYNGSDSFDYTVCDSDNACDTATVTVLVETVNDPPEANDDSVTTDEDTPVSFNVLDNDSDVDGNLDAGSVSVVNAPTDGSLSDNGNGDVTYTPDADFFGSDSFSYQVCDDDGVCDTADVSITVNSVNDAPVCTNVTPSVSTIWPPNHQWVPVTFSGATDIEGDAISISVTSIFQDEPTNGTGDGDTSPDGQGIGSDTAQVRAERAGNGNGRYYHITVSADDGNGGSCSATVQVSVPKNQGKKGAAVDDGPLYDSTQP